MNANPIDQILNLINSVKTLEDSANSLKNLPVVGDIANQILTPLDSIKTSVSGIGDLISKLQPLISMIPDVPGTWDDDLKKALASLGSSNTISNIGSTDHPTPKTEEVIPGVNLSDGIGLDDVMGFIGNLDKK